jgi:uncharacterized protein YeaO (DUF488 family)
MIKLRRAYDPISTTDGRRFLVERLWPRGLTKAKVHVAAWHKEVGPSTALRQWFGHDPEKWATFRTRLECLTTRVGQRVEHSFRDREDSSPC